MIACLSKGQLVSWESWVLWEKKTWKLLRKRRISQRTTGRQSALTIIYFHYDWRLDWTTLVIELEYGLFWVAFNSTGRDHTALRFTWLDWAVLKFAHLEWAVTDCTALHLTGLDSTAVGCKGPRLFRIEMHCTVLDWTGLVWTERERTLMNGLHCTAMNWTALGWTTLKWTGLDGAALH